MLQYKCISGISRIRQGKKTYSKNCGIEGGVPGPKLIFIDIWDPNIEDFWQKKMAPVAQKA